MVVEVIHMYPEIDKKKTGERLGDLFRLNRLKPKDIQEYLSLSCVQTIYRWLDGVNIPCIDHLYALSVLMNIPVDYIIVGKKKRELCLWEEISYRRMFLYGEKARQKEKAA